MIRLTPAVKNILIINVAVYLISIVLLQTTGINLDKLLALYNIGSDSFYPHQFITYMFAHDLGGFSHVFFNMLMLVFMGAMVEEAIGSKRFLSFSIICGVSVGVIWMIWQTFPSFLAANDLNSYLANPDYPKFINFMQSYYPHVLRNLDNYSEIEVFIEKFETAPTNPVILEESKELVSQLTGSIKKFNFSIRGFSGVVFGVVALAGMIYPDREVGFLFLPFRFKLKYMVLFLTGLQFYYLLSQIQSNTSYISHVFGIGVALIMLKVWEIIDQRKA